jgi:replicative DNA helicase
MSLPATRHRSPPYSVQSEKALLGALLVHPDLLPQVADVIGDGQIFFRQQFAELYAGLARLQRQGALGDDERLAAEVRGRAFPDVFAARRLIAELKQAACPPQAAMQHAGVVRDKANLRRLIDTLSDLLYDVSRSSEGFEDALLRARQRLQRLAREAGVDPR